MQSIGLDDRVAGQTLASDRTDAEPARTASLADTVLTYVDCGLNVRLTAQLMGVQLNTVHNRLERVAELLARPELRPVDLVEVATAIRICRSAGAWA